MHVIEVNDLAELEQHKEAWTALLNDIDDPSAVFANPGWAIEWWRHFHDEGRLGVLFLMADTRLVGVAPLAIWRWPFAASPLRVLRFLGNGTSDHLDICIHPDFRERGLPVLGEHIRERMRWHFADLLDIPEDSPNLPALQTLLRGRLHSTLLQRAIVCPYLHIGSSPWADYYAGQRSKSTRKDLERRRRRLGELGRMTFRRHIQADDIASAFPRLFDLYEKRWNNKFLSVSFAGTRERAFYPAMAAALSRQGRLDLLTLELDDQLLAFSLGASHKGRFTWLITAHDPDFAKFFPGELMLVFLLESVFQRGDIAEFDFTRGEEDYKYKWADSERYNMRLLVARPSPFGLLPFVTTSVYTAVRRLAKRSAFLRRMKLEVLGKLQGMKPRSHASVN
jgi:CelD/BcsL family acetyltransferase involved in cellulose biosynthesis